jgi:Protein of unknown function (DUF3253)
VARPVDIATIRSEILRQCEARAPDRTICPSEVARALWPDAWRLHMDDVRATAAQLSRDGTIEITQGGEVRNPENEIRGAIRYRIARR